MRYAQNVIHPLELIWAKKRTRKSILTKMLFAINILQNEHLTTCQKVLRTIEGMTFKWVISINNLVSQNIVNVMVNDMWTFHVPSNAEAHLFDFGDENLLLQPNGILWQWNKRLDRDGRDFVLLFFGNILWFWIWMGKKLSKIEKCYSWM